MQNGPKPDLPHDGVWCRLGASKIHGIGVFAIAPIPQGTDVFANEIEKTVWIDAETIAVLPDASPHRRLYADFAIARGGRLRCPVNFNLLTVGWYVNQPVAGDEPNLEIGEDDTMIARRNIAMGEEMTIIYATFSNGV